MELSIVIPVLDEEANIEPLCARLTAVLAPLAAPYEILFIDDGSRDKTLERIVQRHAQDPHVKALSFSRRFGHQQALTAGLDYASGRAVICMDGDLQHPPELIPDMVKFWKEGHDLVFTVRGKSPHIGRAKKILSDLFYPFFSLLSGVRLPPQGADFRLMDRRVVDAFREIRERTRFMRGLSAWVGYRSTCLFYAAPPRLAGRTKYSWAQMARLSIDALLSFSAAPLYAGVLVGFFLCLFVLGYAVFALYARIVTHHVLAGWTSMAILISGIGSLQIMLTGIVGLYVAKVYEESKQRPLYLIRDCLGIEKKPLPSA
jgi:dolichol-phosphate mannosyltransferase